MLVCKVTSSERVLSFKRNYTIKFVSVMIFFIGSELTVFLLIGEKKQWKNFWACNFIPMMIGRIKHLHYIYLVNLIELNLSVIRWRLDQLINVSSIQNTVPKNYMYKKLKRVREDFSRIWNVVLYMNNGYGIPLLTNFLQNFIQITCDLFWIYMQINSNENDSNIG